MDTLGKVCASGRFFLVVRRKDVRNRAESGILYDGSVCQGLRFGRGCPCCVCLEARDEAESKRTLAVKARSERARVRACTRRSTRRCAGQTAADLAKINNVDCERHLRPGHGPKLGIFESGPARERAATAAEAAARHRKFQHFRRSSVNCGTHSLAARIKLRDQDQSSKPPKTLIVILAFKF